MTANEIIRNVAELEIIAQYENMSADEVVSLWNDYCEDKCYVDDQIFSNDEEFFQTYFDQNDMMRVIQATFYGHYAYADDWVQFNGYANLDTSDDPTELMHWSKDDITEWVLEENGGYYSFDLDEERIEDEASDIILSWLEDYDSFDKVQMEDLDALVEYVKDNGDDELWYALESFIEETYQE